MKKLPVLFVLVLAFVLGGPGAVFASGARLLVPGTPSSIPLIIAAQNSGNVDVKVVHNLSQAHAGFIRGDADLLLTGLSVGIKFYEQGLPVKMLATHVTSLSYLVYNNDDIKSVTCFADLAGKKIRFPFPGSPLEEVSNYFAAQEGLELGRDIGVGYGDFQSTVQMIGQGKVEVAVLPEPFVSLALKNTPVLAVGIDYGALWQSLNTSTYPQVVLLGKSPWLDENAPWMEQFMAHLVDAVELCRENPQKAVELTEEQFALSPEILESALTRTRFDLKTGSDLKDTVLGYYKTIGRDLEKRTQMEYGELF